VRLNITILPTLNNSEEFGMVLIEVGVCGKPVNCKAERFTIFSRSYN